MKCFTSIAHSCPAYRSTLGTLAVTSLCLEKCVPFHPAVSPQDINLGTVCIAKDRANNEKLFKTVSLLQQSPDEIIRGNTCFKAQVLINHRLNRTLDVIRSIRKFWGNLCCMSDTYQHGNVGRKCFVLVGFFFFMTYSSTSVFERYLFKRSLKTPLKKLTDLSIYPNKFQE